MAYEKFWDKVPDGGASIFEFYNVNVDTRRKQNNPLRNGSKNFSVKRIGEKYIFRDWVSDAKGDAIAFLCELLNIDYIEAIGEAEKIYQFLPPERPARPKPQEPELPQAFPSAYELRLLASQESNFHHFCLGLGITREHLEKWNVGASAGYTYFAYQDINQVYVHRKRMAYQPNGKSVKSETRYLTRRGFHFKECLFGEHLLRSQTEVFIVESEKTAVVASFFYPQYDFLAVGGANGLDNKLHRIQVLQGKKVYWLSDADSAGRDNSSLRALAHYAGAMGFDFEKIDLFPDLGQRKDCPKKGYDLADWLVDSLPQVRLGNLLPLIDPNLFLVNGYLSELLENDSFTQIIFAPQVKVNLQAGTGAGKTTIAKAIGERWAEMDGKKTIICVPLNAIAESKHEESKLTKVGGIPYFVSKFLQPKYLPETYHDIQNNSVLFCNYDALPKLCEIIRQGGYDYNLIVDEQHCLTTDYGFRREKVLKIYEMIHEVDKCLLLSADTIPEAFQKFRHLRVVNQAKPRTIQNFQVKDRHKLLPALVQQIRLRPNKTLVLLNSKKQLAILKNTLEANDLRAHIIESGVNLFSDEAYQTLMRQKAFPENIDVLLCTSVIATGIDIYVNEPIDLIYAENNYGFNTILCNQFFSRVRNTEMANYFTLSLHSPYESQTIDPSQLYQKKFKSLRRQLEKLRAETDHNLESLYLETPYAEKLKAFYRTDSGKLKIDKLAVSYWVQSQKIRNGSPAELSTQFTLLTEFAPSIQAEIKLSKAEEKEKLIAQEAEILALYQTQKTELAQALLAYTQNQTLKQYLKDFYPTTERIFAQHILPTAELAKVAEQVFAREMSLEKIGISEANYSALIFDLDNQRLLTNAKYSLEVNRLKINLCLEEHTPDLGVLEQSQVRQYQAIKIALQNRLKESQELTSEEIQTIVNRHYTLKMSRHKCTQIARTLFVWKEKIKTEDEKKVRYYVCLGETNFAEVCRKANIETEPIKAKMRDYLRRKRLERDKKLQFSRENLSKIEAGLNCSKTDLGRWFYENFTVYLPNFHFETLAPDQQEDYQRLYQWEIERSNPIVTPF